MRDRRNSDDDSIFDFFDGCDDDARSILNSLRLPFFFFVIPQVGKRDDETYLGFRKSHALSRAAVRSRHRDSNP